MSSTDHRRRNQLDNMPPSSDECYSQRRLLDLAISRTVFLKRRWQVCGLKTCMHAGIRYVNKTNWLNRLSGTVMGCYCVWVPVHSEGNVSRRVPFRLKAKLLYLTQRNTSNKKQYSYPYLLGCCLYERN